jgi:hypothetical protein
MDIRTWLDWRLYECWILGESSTVDQPWTIGRRGIWLALPADKSRNSWRWLCCRLGRRGRYWSLRWTLPRFLTGEGS